MTRVFHSHFSKGDWKWDVHSPENCFISENEKRFQAFIGSSSLARSNYGMSAGTGVYTIKIRLDEFWNRILGIGVCLKDVNLGNWECDPKNVVWGMLEDVYGIEGIEGRIHPPCEDNVFFQKCKVIGGAVPHFNSGDEVQMIYDSNKGEMRFKRNGEYLSSTVKNLNSVGDLYWCVGTDPCWKWDFDVSIVD